MQVQLYDALAEQPPEVYLPLIRNPEFTPREMTSSCCDVAKSGTFLCRAAMVGCDDAVEAILERLGRTELEYRTPVNSVSPLHFAAMSGNGGCIRLDFGLATSSVSVLCQDILRSTLLVRVLVSAFHLMVGSSIFTRVKYTCL